MPRKKKSPRPVKIRALRESLGLTQDEFYPRLGVSQSAGSRYENGTRPVPQTVRLLVTYVYKGHAVV
jgi:DNA-binding transcriptional regulator YiaG